MLALLTGCTLPADHLPPGEDGEAIAQSEDAIVNGQLDTEHDAVVAVFGKSSGCTATVIHVQGGYAYILTAAHCFGQGAVEVAVMADDYQSPSAKAFSIVDYQIHPSYNAQNILFDFAMMKAAGAGPNVPFIPALSPQEDILKKGTVIDHVGYGLTKVPNGSTTKRHHVEGKVDQLAKTQFRYNQPIAGPCSGDSGGPNLVDTANGERVAGVISYGDQQCNQMGVSGRVTAVYDSFIMPFINKNTGSSSASSSASSSSSTSSSSGAGGSTGVGSGGVGGSGVSDDGNWVAGNYEDRSYAGDVLTSCSVSATNWRAASSRHSGSGHASWLLLLALGLTARRRSS